MSSTTLSRKWIAACVAVAVWSVYSMVVLASPSAKASGELSVSGNVTVNGLKAISGGTLFSDSSLITAEKSNATVSIGKLGRVELAPNSSLRLSFSDNGISGSLEKGSASVSSLAGVTVNLTTREGLVVVDGSNATSITVTSANDNTLVATQVGSAELRTGGAVKMVAAGENASTGTNPMPQGPIDDVASLSGGGLAVLLLAVGGAVAAVLYATLHDNDLNFGGNVTVVSQSK
jgi:hypothetical protein